MPVTQANYDHRGGGNYGIVMRCPNIVGDRLVYFDYNAQRHSWVIRDFISGLSLSNNDSQLTVPQIEFDANHDEFPPWRDVSYQMEWATYLFLRTSAQFRLGALPTITQPNPVSGRWRNI